MFYMFLKESIFLLPASRIHTNIICVFIILVVFVYLLVSKYILNVSKVYDEKSINVCTSFKFEIVHCLKSILFMCICMKIDAYLS